LRAAATALQRGAEGEATDNKAGSTTTGTAESTRTVLYPPGTGAGGDKTKQFCNHVDRSLRRGEEVEIVARGPGAVRHVFSAFSSAGKAAEFSVAWAGPHGNRFLRFVAKPGLAWEEYLQTRRRDTAGIVANSEIDARQLAQNLVRALAADRRPASNSEAVSPKAVRIHSHADDDAALYTLAKALAVAPTVEGYHMLTCTPNIVKPADAVRPRLFVYVQSAPAEVPLGPTGSTFRALPPGRESAAEAVQRFGRTVQDRLRLGDEVEMECRGQEAVNNAVRVLCYLRDHTAELEAEWAEVEASRDGTDHT